jgi:hypothetical protein
MLLLLCETRTGLRARLLPVSVTEMGDERASADASVADARQIVVLRELGEVLVQRLQR